MNKYVQKIDLVFDFHGLSKKEAEEKLISLCRENSGKNIRIITGKGLNSLKGPVIREMVKVKLLELGLDYRPAKLKDGGEGALEIKIPPK